MDILSELIFLEIESKSVTKSDELPVLDVAKTTYESSHHQKHAKIICFSKTLHLVRVYENNSPQNSIYIHCDLGIMEIKTQK